MRREHGIVSPRRILVRCKLWVRSSRMSIRFSAFLERRHKFV